MRLTYMNFAVFLGRAVELVDDYWILGIPEQKILEHYVRHQSMASLQNQTVS